MLLLLVTFFKQLLWVGLVPLWHFPDEPNHFAQIQNCAELGACVGGPLSDEITRSERILQVFRDTDGRNAYTFHPEFNIPYSTNEIGVWEPEIRRLPVEYTGLKNNHLATSYPPFYYRLSSWWYRMMGTQSLIERVFAVRIFSALIFTATVWLAVLIGKVVSRLEIGSMIPSPTRGGDLFPLALGILVAFQPLASFVGASVNSDVLFNFFFTLFLYGGVSVLCHPGRAANASPDPGSNEKKVDSMELVNGTLDPRSRPLCLPAGTVRVESRMTNGVYLGWLIILIALVGGFLTKQQMVIALFILPVLFIPYLSLLLSYLKTKPLLSLSAGVVMAGLGWGLWRLGELNRILLYVTVKDGATGLNPVPLIEHLRWTFIHTYREVLPWYWGVFKWLGVVLPRWVLRVQMGILFLSGIGIAGYFLNSRSIWYLVFSIWGRKPNLETQNTKYPILNTQRVDKVILFLSWSVLAYFAALTLWDWQFRNSHGFSFGVQGRYFLPVLVPSMVMIMVGLSSLAKHIWCLVSSIWGKCRPHMTSDRLPVIKEIQTLLSVTCYLLLVTWFLILHTIALYVVAKSYYDVSSWQAFVIQASQYKPIFFKGWWWGVWGGLAGMFVIILNIQILSLLISRRKMTND